jgi:hypothetical protein
MAKEGMKVADAGGTLLLAEGDSWFDHPFADVLGELQDLFNAEPQAIRAEQRVFVTSSLITHHSSLITAFIPA